MTNFESFLIILFLLLLGHAFADFSFQSSEMGKGKNRNRVPENVPPGQTPTAVWPYWLTAHASVHAGFVILITGNIFLSLGELFAHWIIDFFKCENELTVHQDQALHLFCKVIWAALLTWNFMGWASVLAGAVILIETGLMFTIVTRLWSDSHA